MGLTVKKHSLLLGHAHRSARGAGYVSCVRPDLWGGRWSNPPTYPTTDRAPFHGMIEFFLTDREEGEAATIPPSPSHSPEMNRKVKGTHSR